MLGNIVVCVFVLIIVLLVIHFQFPYISDEFPILSNILYISYYIFIGLSILLVFVLIYRNHIKYNPIITTKAKVLNIHYISPDWWVTFSLPKGKKCTLDMVGLLNEYYSLKKGDIVILKYKGDEAISVKKISTDTLDAPPNKKRISKSIKKKS